MDCINNEMKYDIICNENSEYDSCLYTAVKTTGVYCIPSCSAKETNEENVEFYNTTIAAEASGYRPCKICCPNLLKVKWKDFKKYIEIDVPEEFSFEQCMVYLNRSDIECLHKIKDGEFYKLLKFETINVLINISIKIKKLKITFMDGVPAKWIRAQVAKYVWDMFDLGTDLTDFYKLTEDDFIIKLLVNKYKGLRIIKINDMFETICWAIIGQQINLKFAYTLKKRLVECYGEKMVYDNDEYFIFPTPKVISTLEVEDLKLLQFTTRKAEYIIGIANLVNNGTIKKEELALEKVYDELKKRLVSIRGVGNWTADYTIMKCFDINDAFPIADVGVHNALKGILGLDKKPTIDEIEELAVNWRGWEAYATFYLWRCLND
jgi:DNA-3-methyladenine glycosylase II